MWGSVVSKIIDRDVVVKSDRMPVAAPRMDDLKDADLITRAQQGDRYAFDQLVVRHQDQVYNAAYRFTGNAEDAADVAQMAFLNAFKSILSFRQDASFTTWLYRIAFNQSVSMRRSKPRVNVTSLESLANDDPSTDQTPARTVQSQETQQQVQDILNSMPEEDRTIIVLKDIQGCSYQEIAEIVQAPVATLRSRVFRARMELKKRLETMMLTDM